MLFPLIAGVAIGLGILLALALLFGRRRVVKTWRGYANAVATGIALGAMFDLLPVALGQATLIFGLVLRTQIVERFALAPDSFLGIGAPILNQAVVPVGALLVLFLYLAGNTVPRRVNGQLVGNHTQGWRAWFVVPEGSEVDWRGIGLLTIGLAAQNLWLGHVRGALLSPTSSSYNLFLYAVALVGTLRGLALFGSFADPAKRWLPFSACVLVMGAAVVFAVSNPSLRNTIELGVVPLFVAILLLPLAMGRLLRSVEYDIGLRWQTTLVVIATLGVERACGYLLLLMAQGQIG